MLIPACWTSGFRGTLHFAETLVHNKFWEFGIDDEKAVSKNGLHIFFKLCKTLNHARDQVMVRVRNPLIAVYLGRFGLATCDNAEQFQGDLLQSASLCSRLKSSSFICQLLF